MTDVSLTLEVAEFAAKLKYDDLPQDVVVRAKEAVIDGLAVMLAGSRTHEGQLIQRYVASLGAAGTASLVGTKLATQAPFAALANGVSGHAQDYDDTQLAERPDRVYGLLTHPTTPVLAATLAAAQEAGATGRETLTAFAGGVEVACKVAEAINPHHYQNGFHSTGTIGVFGAAAAAARLMRLSTEQTRHAIGIAASKSAGIRAAFGTMTKPYHAGAAAENGVVAARLAALGWRADPNALDGKWGFFQVAGGGGLPEVIRGRMGNPHTLVNPGVSIKPYPCGSLAHPSMDAMLDLVLKHDVRPEQVAEVRLGTSSNVLNALRYQTPEDALQAKFSLQFAMSALILERRAGIREYTDDTVRRPDVRQMMGRVVTYLDPQIEAKGFARIRSAIEVRLTDGRVLTTTAETSRGTPERPMTKAELEVKFRDCAEGVISRQAMDDVLGMAYNLESAGDIGALMGRMSG
ncbi:MAG: MmgE/PrpD family protein [Chloroflexota bacterium]|nr:MmgE/PrpD family protein [Chloroflexota bacterium]